MDINAFEIKRSRDGNDDRAVGTALIYAAATGNVKVAKLLLERGADISLLDTAGEMTALGWARKRIGNGEYNNGMREEVAKILVAVGAV